MFDNVEQLNHIESAMTKRQIENLLRACGRFDVTFNEYFYRHEEVEHVIRWSKSRSNPTRKLVSQKLKDLGCRPISRVGPKLNLEWLESL
jgi:hypothetical protein